MVVGTIGLYVAIFYVHFEILYKAGKFDQISKFHLQKYLKAFKINFLMLFILKNILKNKSLQVAF